MRVDFSSDCFGAALAAPKARSAKLSSCLRAWPTATARMTRAQAAPNGSSFPSRFPEKVSTPDFKIPAKARRCCLTLASRVRGQPARGLGLVRLRDPIPLPQRLRLLCAAKRVERVGSDAGAILGPGVIPSENLFVCGEGCFAESERFGRMAAYVEQKSQIAARVIGVWMLGAEHLFAYCQRALEKRPRPRKVALAREREGEVVEARRRIGMLWAERLLADRQRAL